MDQMRKREVSPTDQACEYIKRWGRPPNKSKKTGLPLLYPKWLVYRIKFETEMGIR